MANPLAGQRSGDYRVAMRPSEQIPLKESTIPAEGEVGTSPRLSELKSVRTAEERLALLDEMLTEAAGLGLLMRTPDDEPLDGRTLSLRGRSTLNFGSCSYLGLELDPRMREAVCAAVMRYGTQFSSSRTYMSAPLYPELEHRLELMFGGHVLVVPSTSMGHIAALPVLVGSGDAVVLDQQLHHSVQSAVNQLRPQGTTVELIRHSRLDQLEEAIERLAPRHRSIWYLADGVYSMYADLAPFARLVELLDRHEQLHLYIDDSHGVGWSGVHGRGPALQAIGNHERVVVAASLNKSFAAAGAALVFPAAELKRRVRTLGGPMIFSGPVQPPMLGAALASARIHLSPELEQRQAALRERISLSTELLQEFCLPLQCAELTPIRYVTLGLPRVAETVAARLLDDGFYVNLAMFPAVPMKQAGVRFTLTLHQQPRDIRALVEALARHVPDALAATAVSSTPRAGATPAANPAVALSRAEPTAGLRLEHHRSIVALDAREWDSLLGARGSFSASGLDFLERAFGGGRPEDRWMFHYYIVRDEHGRPVLATFFTAGLWKEDMLSTTAVSRLVEARRADDPYYLTAQTFAMGSLLSEGDHLYLDRDADWRGALGMLLEAIGEHAQQAGAGTIVLRDLAAGDRELGDALHENGYVKLTMPDSLILDAVAPDDTQWLDGLSPRSRVHQRREVIPFDATFDIEILRHGGRVPNDHELSRLHGLYCNVREHSLEINSFELPRTMLREMLAHDCWELMVMRLRDHPSKQPIAFGAHFIGPRHYAPMIIGLDYEHVRTHHSYRQALRQALLRARAHRSERVLLGMGASLEKHRFGATATKRCAYAQSAEHYNQEVLAAIAAEALAAA
jgi:7-keto-8-aminopelargonate synthetase-like enzyme